MAWTLVWYLVPQIAAILASNCFMVNDLSHSLRWEVSGSDAGSCTCYNMLPGGVSASLPQDIDVKLCHEMTNLYLTSSSLTLSPNCSVTEAEITKHQVINETERQSTDDTTEVKSTTNQTETTTATITSAEFTSTTTLVISPHITTGLTKRKTKQTTSEASPTQSVTSKGTFIPTSSSPSYSRFTEENFETRRTSSTHKGTPELSTLKIKVSTEELSTTDATTSPSTFTSMTYVSTINKYTSKDGESKTSSGTTSDISNLYSKTTESDATTMDLQDTTAPAKSTSFSTTTQMKSASFKTTAESMQKPYTNFFFVSTDKYLSTVADITSIEKSTTNQAETTTATITSAESTSTTTLITSPHITTDITSIEKATTNQAEKTTATITSAESTSTTTLITSLHITTDLTSIEKSTTNQAETTTATITSAESASTTTLITSPPVTSGNPQALYPEENVYKNSRYILHTENLTTLATAEEACRASGENTRLVTLQDKNENLFVTDLVNSSSTPDLDFWIGLKNTKFKWINGTYMSYDNFGFNIDDPVKCFYFHKSYVWPWETKNCSTPLNFICEVSWNGGDSAHCNLLEGNTCYILHSTKTTFYSALNICKNIGGSLLQLETFEEENMLKPIIHNDGVWLGITWTSGEKSEFVWNDDFYSPANYTNFGGSFGGFGKFCVHSDGSRPPPFKFEWLDYHCEGQKAYICEEKLE